MDVNEVEIFRRGDEIVLRPRPKSWEDYFRSAGRFTDDFPDRIEDAPPEEREVL
jgi:antitoxin VapB